MGTRDPGGGGRQADAMLLLKPRQPPLVFEVLSATV